MCSGVTTRTILQKANRRAAAEKIVRKIEAGAIPFVVAQTIGLSTGRSPESCAGRSTELWTRLRGNRCRRRAGGLNSLLYG